MLSVTCNGSAATTTAAGLRREASRRPNFAVYARRGKVARAKAQGAITATAGRMAEVSIVAATSTARSTSATKTGLSKAESRGGTAKEKGPGLGPGPTAAKSGATTSAIAATAAARGATAEGITGVGRKGFDAGATDHKGGVEGLVEASAVITVTTSTANGTAA